MLTGGDDYKGNSNGNGHKSWWSRRKKRDKDSPAFQRLALQLHYELSSPGPSRSVLLTTPGSSPAPARTALTLACAMAREIRKPVLLIDANPDAPLSAELLDGVSSTGFSDLLEDPSLALAPAVLPTSEEHVHFLGCGAGHSLIPDPESISRVLLEATAAYNFVILAGGGVLNDSLARAIGPAVGCVLLIAVENETMTDDLDAAQAALARGNARRVGVVMATTFGSAV